MLVKLRFRMVKPVKPVSIKRINNWLGLPETIKPERTDSIVTYPYRVSQLLLDHMTQIFVEKNLVEWFFEYEQCDDESVKEIGFEDLPVKFISLLGKAAKELYANGGFLTKFDELNAILNGESAKQLPLEERVARIDWLSDRLCNDIMDLMM